MPASALAISCPLTQEGSTGWVVCRGVDPIVCSSEQERGDWLAARRDSHSLPGGQTPALCPFCMFRRQCPEPSECRQAWWAALEPLCHAVCLPFPRGRLGKPDVWTMRRSPEQNLYVNTQSLTSESPTLLVPASPAFCIQHPLPTPAPLCLHHSLPAAAFPIPLPPPGPASPSLSPLLPEQHEGKTEHL